MNDENNNLYAEESIEKYSEISDETAENNETYSKLDCIFAFIVMIISFFFVKFVVYSVPGFIATILYIAIITLSIVFLKKNGCTFSRFNKLLAAVLYLFSVVFSITDNQLIKLLCVAYMFISGAYFVYSVSVGKNKIDRFLPFAFIKSIFEFPFISFGSGIGATKSVSHGSKFGSSIKMILIGLCTTIPLTVVVGMLLMSADEGVADILKNFTSIITNGNIIRLIWQLCIAVPCFCYLFGMLYSAAHKGKTRKLDDNACQEKLDGVRSVQNLILYTAVTPICILYVIFFISQANYFLSAFAGKLPDGYIYSDYARRGFFELFAISLINLAVIIVINIIARNSGKNKPVGLKFYSIMLCVFTLVMIAVAVSKMVMYISAYGLTRLRFYTTWFMALCAIFFILIIIKQLRYEFNASRWCTAAFTFMFALLCFSRPDAMIARFNIEMYNSGQLNQLDTDALLEMSDDSVLTAIEMGVVDVDDVSDMQTQKTERYRDMNLSSLIIKMKLD